MDNERAGGLPEREFVLQWGKRLRCVRTKNHNASSKSNSDIRRRTASRFLSADPSRPLSNGLARGSDASPFRSSSSDGRKSVSPDKEERYYATRGSFVGGGYGGVDESRKSSVEGGRGEKGAAAAWPKLYITLSNKEKEEDFLAMKGCKLPQRPKKRAKFIQRTLLFVSPGAWLTDMCQERYQVREKKTSKKRARGLKAMGGALDSDSE